MSPDTKENVIIHECYLSRFLGTFDTQDTELNWNLGGIVRYAARLSINYSKPNLHVCLFLGRKKENGTISVVQ